MIAWPPAPPPVVDPAVLPPGARGARVRVLHVVTKLVAGAGGNTLLSAIGMDPARYEVWVVGSEEGGLWRLAEESGVRTVRLRGFEREVSPLADLRVFLRLVALIRRERFAIVHTHNAKGGFLGRLAARVCRTPVVLYSLHGRDPWWPVRDAAGEAGFDDVMGPVERLGYLVLERSLRRITHGFVAVSPRVAASAVQAGIARAGSVDVAPSAVDLRQIPAAFDPMPREELGIPADVPVVGWVGRLDPQKAPLDFVRMAAILRGSHPDVRFVMVGEGSLASETRLQAERLGVPVLFTGFRSDAPRIAATFDVFVVSSLYEGVGRSVTEALASGRPVVATAVDGVPDLVEPGSTGLLAPARDPVAMAACVGWMLDHPDEARAMGEQGRTRVRALFDPAVMCVALDRIYSGYLGLPPVTAEGPAGWSGSPPATPTNGAGVARRPATRRRPIPVETGRG